MSTPAQSILGFNTFLVGRSGAGKTTSLKTLLHCPGIKRRFVLFTEPRYDVLGSDVLSQFLWRYIPPATAKWKTLINVAKQINTFTNDDLQKGKFSANECLGYVELLEQCNNFTDQNGVQHGDVGTFGTDTILVIDGLTGVGKMAKKLGVGYKPVLSQPDWGVAMNTISEFIDTLSMNTRCHLVFLAHVEQEQDPLTLRNMTMISTLGRKLAPVLPNNFGQVILARRDGPNFYWDTMDSSTELKAGLLRQDPKLPPDFKQLFDAWEKLGGKYEA